MFTPYLYTRGMLQRFLLGVHAITTLDTYDEKHAITEMEYGSNELYSTTS